VERAALELGIPAFGFAFGAICGSFLNVVIYRLPRAGEILRGGAKGDDDAADADNDNHSDSDEAIEDGEGLGARAWLRNLVPDFLAALSQWRGVASPRRSFCPQCRAQLLARDNIPLLSYLLLAARCRTCKASIPVRYFVVELLTGCLFAMAAERTLAAPLLAGHLAQPALFGVFCAVIAAMVAVAYIDIDLLIIPDAIDKPGMLLGLLVAPLVPALHAHNGDLSTLASWAGAVGVAVPSDWGLPGPRSEAFVAALCGLLFGAGLIYLVGWLGRLAFRKEAMGLGDVKYLGMLGAFLGWKGVLFVLVVGCFAGALIGIGIKLASGSRYIPFGPFLSLGGLLVLLARPELSYVVFVWYPGLLRH